MTGIITRVFEKILIFVTIIITIHYIHMIAGVNIQRL